LLSGYHHAELCINDELAHRVHSSMGKHALYCTMSGNWWGFTKAIQRDLLVAWGRVTSSAMEDSQTEIVGLEHDWDAMLRWL
jgi:hypothetical protein